MTPSPLIDLVIADDHAIFRRGVTASLRMQENCPFRFLGEAPNGLELMQLLSTSRPHIILMDVDMPEMNGIEATGMVKSLYPMIGVIGLSFSDKSDTVLAMVHAGADGYLLKDTNPEELTHAIQTVYEGRTYYSPTASTYLTAHIKTQASAKPEKKKALTQREAEVLDLICAGKSSKEIAAHFFVSKRTIDSTRENILKKTGAQNTLQLLRYALKEGLVKG